jgi:hypothetical protein
MLAASDPGSLAGTILNSWLSGDATGLSRVLDEVVSLPSSFGPPSRGAGDERMEILRSVAFRMRQDNNLFTPRSLNPRAGSWLDLLRHFSSVE